MLNVFAVFDKTIEALLKEAKDEIHAAYIDRDMNYFVQKTMYSSPTQNFQNGVGLKQGAYNHVVGKFQRDLESQGQRCSTYQSRALRKELIMKVRPYFEHFIRLFQMESLLQAKSAFRISTDVFAVNYNPYFSTQDKITIVHCCPKDGWVHRNGLKLRCRVCKAKVGKSEKMAALLALRLEKL